MDSPFKPRELEILRLLAEGLTNPEIGARLHLAHDTVRWYNKHLFEKLGATNRLQAVQRAVEQGQLPGPGLTPAPTRPPIHYLANGDVHLAYQVVGHGPVDLLFIHGFLSHLELAWENPEYRAFFEHLGRFARVILFDKRGVGLSDRIQGAPSLETTMEDARCILEAVGSQKAYILGTSEGGAAAVLLAATYPERVLGLILIGATAKVVQTDGDPDWASLPRPASLNFLESLYQNWGQPWAAQNFAPSRAHDPHFRAWWAMVLRAASSPSSLKAVLTLVRDVDIRPLLPHIHIRTLVLHKTG
jgi:pimeloyl-ACP methyl ester carboxylesterase/DNA-binding CsgD family transcriptional regulator